MTRRRIEAAPRPLAAGHFERGVALLAVLFALVLLLLLALPFAVSMGVGAEAAAREVDLAAVEQASASARDLLLADAAMSHPAFDPTPTYDSLAEWPDRVELPAAFEPLREEGRVLLGGAVWDLQRFLSLDAVTPLALANLLGTTTRLREDLLPEATAMQVDDADALPESGFVWVAGEVVRYGGKQGAALVDLTRGLFQEMGFGDGKQPVAATALVLDHRCVIAAAWPFTGRGSGLRETRRPFASVGELAEIERAGIGSFTAAELDVLRGAVSVDTMATTAATWGRPERVFDDLMPGLSRSLRVKSALHVGAGSTVRLRNTRTNAVEYALVMAAATERGSPDLVLPSVFRLELLLPVLQEFPAIDTVVEPLVPPPVNVNTAPAPVLEAVFADVRRAADVRVHEADGRRRAAPPLSISRTAARELAAQIETLRAGDPGQAGQGPFTGWQDLAERVFRPRFEAASGDPQKQVWLYLYRNLQTGRDNTIEMGTAPLCFQSGPWVGYRAAASRSRSVVAPGVAGRHERTGLAAAVPGFTMERVWETQETFEEAFQLDRRAPFWVTTPVNLGALQPGDQGSDPAPRFFPHVVPMAYPGLGFGSPRFPAKDAADASIQPATATARSNAWAGAVLAADSFAQALDPRGHDVAKDGPYRMQNTGPKAGAAQGGQGGGAQAGGGRHDRISFPFANQDSFVGRFGTSFWLQARSLEGTTLFDHSDGDPDRNRLCVLGRDGNLVFEVVDEAGIDPNPSDSPAGVERTATTWNLPLAELGLPADTPVHLSVSAYGSRPSELSFAVDGMTRGKPAHVTYLTAALKAFDPTLANNSGQLPPGPGNERYLDVQVESTDGFPPVGTLRIGTELFEYSGISGNSFQCQWKDSLGGRGARQVGREHRPDIPVDQNGEPTVDIDTLQQQGVNLDVFPEHPAGAQVELYGYSALLSEDSPMMVGTTRLDGAVGGFAVARGWINNPRPILITPPTGPPFTIGTGIDDTWTGELELADPVPSGRTYPPPEAQSAIADAFSATGGYALLVQSSLDFQGGQTGQLTSTTRVGGVELVRYGARQGTKLTGVQRAQTVPGDDAQISRQDYQPGVAQRFVTNWTDWPLDDDPQAYWDDLPTLILWVVPVSLGLQRGSAVWDPVQTGLSEWVQLYPDGGDVNDTEWVRYDVLAEGKHLVRGNRRAWDRLRYELTQSSTRQTVQIGPLGPQATPTAPTTPPWGTVATTSGHIGYTPKLESDFPQIQAARRALRFRGDPFTGTSSHAHGNSVVMQCQRLQLNWGNFGAFSGRVGRHDRVALVQGSVASGSTRPAVEWHTVNWQARRFNADNLAQNQTPSERLGPWPFQLVAFRDGVRGAFLGPPQGTVVLEPRGYDRIVKYPSGELPAAYCEEVAVGGGVGNLQPITGFVDEVEVTSHPAADLVVEEPFTAAANSFRLLRSMTYNSTGPIYHQNDLTAALPKTGGLVAIDGEILAYQGHQDGVFTVAQNGRGLLNTEARDHDRGACVHFLTHRPAAILASGVGALADVLPVQSRDSLPRTGTLLLGRELLHYAWMRQVGDQGALEMPRWYPPGKDPTDTASRGLFRGRYGTTPQGGSGGEAVIAFPFRYWDRHVDRSDDPELAYFQLTTTEAPAFYRSLRWREETTDPRVDVVCLVRTDSKAPWTGEPGVTPGLWRFDTPADSDAGHRIAAAGSRLEIRFATVYKPGVLDLVTFRAHGWKTSARVEKVRLEYEGQGRILDEQVTAR